MANGLRQVLFFREYLVPSRKKHPILHNLVTKSYAYLLLEKAFAFSMPYTIKIGLDSLARGEPPQLAATMFLAVGVSKLASIAFQGNRIILNSRLTRLVFMDTSSKVFHSLLQMDW